MPLDRSLLRPYNWTMTFDKIKDMVFYVQEAQIPSMSIETLTITPGPVTFKGPGDRINFDDALVVSIILDEQLRAYEALYKWMWEIRNPIDANKHKNLEDCFSDAAITVRGNNQQTIGAFRFVGCWPLSLPGPALKSNTSEDEPVTLQIQLGYNYFEWGREGFPVIPDFEVPPVSPPLNYFAEINGVQSQVQLGTIAPINETPNMPLGAIGLWYADEFQSSPRRVIPNDAASGAPISQNLLRAPKGMFQNNEFWFKNGGASVIDGISESRLTLQAGDSFLFPGGNAGSPILPAGEYTMAITARRAVGTDQQFRMSFLNAGLDSGTFTATDTDQRFTFTGTVGAGSQALLIARTVGGAQSELFIKDAVLYAGASAPTEPEFAGHLYIGENQYDAAPTYSSGSLNLSADGAQGLVQFSSDLSLAEYTVVAVASKAVERTHSSILCNPVDHPRFFAAFDISKTIGASFLPIGQPYENHRIVSPDGYNPLSQGWRFIAHRCSNTESAFFANDTKLIQKSFVGSGAVASVSNLLVGAFSSTTLTGGYEINSIALYDRVLSDAEILQAYDALKARANSSGLTIDPTTSKYVVAVGDSLTVDQTTPSYAHLFFANASPRAYGSIFAQSGGTLANLITNAAVIDQVIPASGNGDYILMVLIGTNDLTSSSDVAGFLSSLSSFCSARRAAGWKVAVGTILPGDRVDFNNRRNLANTTIRTWAGVYVDSIVDFAADPNMGQDGDELDTNYFSDGIHPTLLGQQIMESIYRPVINAM